MEQTAQSAENKKKSVCSNIDAQTLEAIEKIKKAFCELGEQLKELAHAYINACGEVVQKFYEAIQKQKKLKNERTSWIRPYIAKIHLLARDKRSKVHRCRNAI